jgi:hypothetical protein
MLNTISGLLAGGVPAGGDYESIATVTVGSGGASSITFSSIPSTYSHLQIRGIAKNASGSQQDIAVQFNSDGGNNYSGHYLLGNGSSASAGGFSSNFLTKISEVLAPSGSANVFGVDITDILDYSNSNKYKTIRNLSGWDANGSGNIYLSSGLWMSSSAISNIYMFPTASANFAQYSSFALYGIK